MLSLKCWKEFPLLFSFFKNKFIYLFIYFWLCWVFVSVRGLSLVAVSGATLHRGARASHCHGLSCCTAQAPDTQAQQLWLTGLVAPRHVGSSQTRARTRVPCIGRQILNHCTTREAPPLLFSERDCVDMVLFLLQNSSVKQSWSGFLFQKVFNYKFNFINTIKSIPVVWFILRKFWLLAVFKELVHFIYVVELIRVELFVVQFYYTVDVCGVCSVIPTLISHIDNFYLLFSLDSFVRGLSILLIF